MTPRLFGPEKRPVHPVGLGCMSFAGFYGKADDGQSLATLSRALELGVNFWDTANIYGDGRSESVIGRFFAEDHTRRARVILATKFGIRRNPDGSRFHDNSAAHLEDSLTASLERLGTDHVDLFYVHRLDSSIPVEITMEALATQVRRGRIKAIGLSEIAPDTLRRAHCVHPVAAVQSEYSLWTRQPELGLIQACAELGVSFVAFSPLGRGYFSGQLRDPSTLHDKDFRFSNPRFTGTNWTRNLARLDAYLNLARRWGVSPSALAIAWTLAKGDHIIPIPGTRFGTHLDEDVQAASLELTAAQLAELEQVLPLGFAAGERYPGVLWAGVERYG